MKRWLPRAVGLVALAALAFFLLRPAAKVDHRVVLDERRIAAVPGTEATLRNVTKGKVTYTIQPNPYSRLPRTRTLAVGDVDHIVTDMPVEIGYDTGARRATYNIFPGNPYSFRYDENGLVKVYPGSHGREDAADLAPYVPTPDAVVERMLLLGQVGPDDVAYDIGCGDGRLVIAAAKSRGARGVGIDIDPKLIEECRANAKKEGVAGRTRFLCMDAMKARITEATVLLLYLLPESLEDLKPLFERDLKPGTRIVSHNYRIPGWDERIVASDSIQLDTGRPHKIYLYLMPGGK